MEYLRSFRGANRFHEPYLGHPRRRFLTMPTTEQADSRSRLGLKRDEVTQARGASERSTDTRNVLACIGIVAAAILLVWPFAEVGYGDDVAYAHVALTLSRTGRLVYNGWEAAMLLEHAYWGAAFIKLFGFSFVCLRLSTVPFALGAIGLCYLLVRRAGLEPSSGLFVTLVLGLSPLFVPLATSYMTDVPGLFFYIASLYCLIRAVDSSAQAKPYGWLALGILVGFVGGTGRQSVWLVPLVLLPYVAWVRRKNLRFASIAMGCWVLTLGGVAAVMSWFIRQPYIVPQPSLFGELGRAVRHPRLELNVFARLSLMLLFICLPAALPLAVRGFKSAWRGTRALKFFVGALCSTVLIAVLIHPSLASIPWVSNTLNWEGIIGSEPLSGRPIVLTRPVRAICALAVYFTCCVLAGELTNFRGLARRLGYPPRDPGDSSFALRAMSLVSIAYVALMIMRAVDLDIFDRYLLPLIPWASAIPLLACEKGETSQKDLRRTMPYAWALLAVLGAYAILGTQDLWSLGRARVAAVTRLETAGVPRTAIDAAFEFNAWTELLASGKINSRWVTNPPGAYRPGLSQTPSVVPIYKLEYEVTPETVPTEFGSVPYFSALPPFPKQVRIDRIISASSSDH